MTHPVKRFWKLLKLYRPELRQIYAYAIFIGVVNLTLPLGIQAIINYIQTGEMTSGWIVLVSFVLLGIAIVGFLQVLQLRVVENIQQDLFARSGFEFAYRIPKISFIELDQVHAPELVNRFFDTLTIQKGLPKILIDFSLAAFQIVFGLILLAVYSPYFIILGLALVLVLWLIFQITGPRGLRTSLIESKFKYGLAHWLEEIARVNRTFKISAANRLHLKKTDAIVDNYLSARESHFSVLINQFRLFIGFKVFVAAGLLVLGGVLVFNEEMDIGQFVAAEIIIILIINSVEKVIPTIDTIYDVLTALEKIGYVTDKRLDQDTGIQKLFADKGLSVKGIDMAFKFPDDTKPIFENLSFEIGSGEKVIIKGPSGSGKTLLLQILTRIYELTDGEVVIDGIDISQYDRKSLYEQFGVAFPTNQLFEGTFKENITLGREVSDKDISEIIHKLKLTDYFAHQEGGVNCQVDSGGRRLPRSIIQKLMIARIIVTKPKLILMEDPLQFVEESEKKEIIDLVMDNPDWTVIVVSDFHYWESKCSQVINMQPNR